MTIRSGARVSCLFWIVAALRLVAQVPGSAGSVEGTVLDPSKAAVPSALVELHNPVSGYKHTTKSDNQGAFHFLNVPPNPYHVTVAAPGFATMEQDAAVRSSVPVHLTINLALSGEKTSVTVEASSEDMVENVPFAHTDIDRSLYEKLPPSGSASGLSDAITLASPGVVADSNGFFHPLGDHAQTSFYIDNQPITDQQSKQFSTQLPLNAIQSMEVVTSAPGAEYGDKTSLVVNAQTRSGLGLDKPFGRLALQYGSFGTYGEEASYGFGHKNVGNFLVANSSRSGRFLDSPEFFPFHDQGNNQTIFNRTDWQPTRDDTLHLNLFLARNWFQVPNTYDQLATGQDQRQLSRSFDISPGYVHVFNPSTLLTVSPFFRQDQINYYPSANPFADQPATMGQKRRLRNYGTRVDLAYVHGIHNFKTGIQWVRTGLSEDFHLGITDPRYNPVCLTQGGDAVTDPRYADPSTCAAAGFAPNDGYLPGLLPYDLSRNGTLLGFRGRAGINQFAWYAQDSITWQGLSVMGGVRVDYYDGLSQDSSFQPRLGLSYQVKQTGTVLRAAYSYTFETPYNENLILSSSTGVGGLGSNAFGGYGSRPLQPGRRDQYNTGLQQAFDRILVVSADYFWKYTSNAFDFGTLFNTPIAFPISWRKSKIDGVSARINLTEKRGFSAFTVIGHTRARFFGPETGGLLFNSPVETSVFRIDHDQAFQQTTNLRYEAPLKISPWIAFTWRYDSGLVAGSVPDLESALALDADQQAAIGFYCGRDVSTVTHQITSCSSANFGATRLVIPAPGTANPDHNPPRIAPRHMFDLAIGADNLLRRERYKVTLRLSANNLANEVALYNFLSTFSGTHFVSPRSYQVEMAFVF